MGRWARRVVLLVASLLVVAGALYLFAGVRVGLDGSGVRPRFLMRTPDYDALEADRARQRQQPHPDPRLRPPARRLRQPVARAPPPPAPSTAAPVVSDWPDFRGPRRDGRYDLPVRTVWPREGLPLLWKQPVGLGYASFVAGGDARSPSSSGVTRKWWLPTTSKRGARSGRIAGMASSPKPWAVTARAPRRPITRAVVYALGALGELRCFDARTGTLVWRRNILADNAAANLDWGMAAAPLIVDDKVIVLPGGAGGKSVAAYHRLTGDPIWQALDDRQAYTSPMLVMLGGIRQILFVSATRAVGLKPDDGALLWEYPWATDMGINAAQPLLLGGDRVFLSAGYGKGATVFEVTRQGDRLATREVWANTRMKNKFSSSVLHEGFVYGLDEAILACVDPATGDQKWKGGRYGYGQIMIAGDHIIVLTETGELALVKATPERHEEIARFPAIEGKTWNHPAISNGRLLVRSLREMAAFDVRPAR